MKIKTLLSFALLSLFSTSSIFALPFGDDDPLDDDDFIEEKKKKELTVKIPGFPNKADLLKIDIDKADSPFVYFIDTQSLKTNSDGISLYTVVIESSTGARNVLFEGLRCRTSDVRSYAYGTQNKLVAYSKSNWRPVQETGAMIHQFSLLKYYLCDDLGNPYSKEDAIRQIKYAENFQDSGFLGD